MEPDSGEGVSRPEQENPGVAGSAPSTSKPLDENENVSPPWVHEPKDQMDPTEISDLERSHNCLWRTKQWWDGQSASSPWPVGILESVFEPGTERFATQWKNHMQQLQRELDTMLYVIEYGPVKPAPLDWRCENGVLARTPPDGVELLSGVHRYIRRFRTLDEAVNYVGGVVACNWPECLPETLWAEERVKTSGRFRIMDEPVERLRGFYQPNAGIMYVKGYFRADEKVPDEGVVQIEEEVAGFGASSRWTPETQGGTEGSDCTTKVQGRRW